MLDEILDLPLGFFRQEPVIVGGLFLVVSLHIQCRAADHVALSDVGDAVFVFEDVAVDVAVFALFDEDKPVVSAGGCKAVIERLARFGKIRCKDCQHQRGEHRQERDGNGFLAVLFQIEQR